jgi:hypothetical protein
MIIAAAAAACALTACSGSDTGNDGGGGGSHHSKTGAGPSSTATGSQTGGDGDASLTVTKAELMSEIGGYYSPSTQGDLFLVLTATLANESQTPPLVASYDLFSLKTVAELVYSPTSVSAELDDACEGDVSVAPGGSKTCAVAFEVPPGVTAQELDYAMPRRISLSASVPAPAQQTCDAPLVGSTSCIDCLQQRCTSTTQQGCQGGELNCMESCWFEGRDLCACQTACSASDACVAAFHQLSTCATTQCGGAGC